MELPSLSSLVRDVLSLRLWVQKLITPKKIPRPPGRRIIRAGTVFWCRPSKYKDLAQRLGEANIQIVDTAETEGFAVTALKAPEPWTHRVYPTDIGPSCAGIDSDTSRISVKSVNDCLTDAGWNLTRLAEGGLQPSTQSSVQTITYSTGLRYLFLNPKADMFFTGKLAMIPTGPSSWADPTARRLLRMFYTKNDQSAIPVEHWGEYFAAVPNDVNKGTFTTSMSTANWIKDYSWTSSVYGTFCGKYAPTHPPINYDTGLLAAKLKQFCGVNDSFPVLFDPFLVCKPGKGYVIRTAYAPNLLVPPTVPFLTLRADVIEKRPVMPTLVYGGYPRDDPPGPGPPFSWGRTVLLQIKLLLDVRL